jgi:hypothetical protein
MATRELHEWAVVKIPSVTFEHCTAEDHSTEKMMLGKRFSPNTSEHSKIHCTIPS